MKLKINIWSSDSASFCWKPKNIDFKPHHLTITVKHGGGFLNMWGCISYFGTGIGEHIKGSLNSNIYYNILSSSLKNSFKKWKKSQKFFIFQQDNDPKHKSKLAQNWFKKEKITLLDWPSQSPDLNPIENLWHELKLKLASYQNKASSIEELWDRCNKEWNDIKPEKCQDYINTMPKRIKAVIRNKGRITKY